MAEQKIWQKYLSALRGKGLLLLLAAAGVLLLLFGGSFGQTAEKNQAQTAEAERAEVEAYRLALQEELTALCTKVEGAGQVSLVVTLEGGGEAVYAADRQDGRVDYVTVGGEGLLLYRKHPTVRGVGVVCTGGSDPEVSRELTSLLAATLGIGTNRIHISCG